MLRTTAITILLIGCLLTALNAGVLILQLSGSSKAAVGGMNAQALSSDADFKRAVQDSRRSLPGQRRHREGAVLSAGDEAYSFEARVRLK